MCSSASSSSTEAPIFNTLDNYIEVHSRHVQLSIKYYPIWSSMNAAMRLHWSASEPSSA